MCMSVRDGDQTPYGVLLMHLEDNAGSGAYVYRAYELPALNDVIEVEDTLTARLVLARVTHVWPRSDYPIQASIERPWPLS